MQLYKIRGGTIEELEGKKYNIGVGISLGNKWFTSENTVEMIRWALAHSKECVVVYVADSIHSINLEIRNRMTKERAKEAADKMGTEFLEKIKTEVEKLFPIDSKERIIYAKWKDLADDRYLKKVSFLYEKYETDPVFRNTVEGFVRGFVSKEQRQFTEVEIHYMGSYLIEEIPELINRVPIKKVICDAFCYPFDGVVSAFAEDLEFGRTFPEIKDNIMDTEPKVFLEVR